MSDKGAVAVRMVTSQHCWSGWKQD